MSDLTRDEMEAVETANRHVREYAEAEAALRLTPAEQALAAAWYRELTAAGSVSTTIAEAAPRLVAAARPHIEAEALEREADEAFKEHHGLHDEAAHENELTPCLGCEWYSRLKFRAHQIRVLAGGGSDA